MEVKVMGGDGERLHLSFLQSLQVNQTEMKKKIDGQESWNTVKPRNNGTNEHCICGFPLLPIQKLEEIDMKGPSF